MRRPGRTPRWRTVVSVKSRLTPGIRSPGLLPEAGESKPFHSPRQFLRAASAKGSDLAATQFNNCTCSFRLTEVEVLK